MVIFNELSLNTVQAHLSGMALPTLDILDSTGVTRKDININESWWLADLVNRQAGYIQKNVFSRCWTDTNNIMGIRPLCSVISGNLKKGDLYLYNNYLFEMLSDSLALCKTVIGFSTYNEAPQIINKWFNNRIKQTVNINNALYQMFGKYEVLKVIDRRKHELPNAAFSLLPCGDGVLPNLIKTGFPYWTQFRESEFTHQYIDEFGFVEKGALTEQHQICPWVEYKPSYSDKPMQLYTLFEYDNKVFRVVSSQTGRALCLNTVGTSCYSTGIANLSECTTNEFYIDSEAALVLLCWVKQQEGNVHTI